MPPAQPPAPAGGAGPAVPPDPTEQLLREAEAEAERRSAASQPPEVSWGITCMAPSSTGPLLALSPLPSAAPSGAPVVPALLPPLPATSVGLVGGVAPP